MQIHNAAVTGSFTYNGVDISSITGSTSNITSLNATTASILSTTASLNLYTGSNDTNISNINSTTASLNSYTGSNNTNISNIHSTTASLNTFTGSAQSQLSALQVTSGSNITRIGALESASGSAITRLNSIESTTGSLNAASGSAISRLSSLESKTGSYATTGSNTFVDGQYLSSSFNPTGFTTTASLYTDGGLRVGRDAYISGTLYLNNVTVYGTQSVCFITSSQLNIASNIISVNTATPSVRFGGLSVYDSGSTGLTGSLLWDSQDNQWVYSNPSGSEYDSAMFLVGPRNTGTLGGETGITCNFLSKGNGLHHMTSSGIFEDGSRTCFYGTSRIDSSGNACFSNTVCAPSFVGGTISGTTGTFSSNVVATGSLIVAPSSNVELQVQSTGVTIGNLVTDSHQITGSLLTSGSVLSFSPLLRVCACTLEPGNTVTSYTSLQPQGFDFNTACSSGNRGIRIYANNTLALSPGGAAIQFFSSDHSNFPGQFYMDSGANNNAALIFRTAVTAGNITERMRITSAGVACFSCQVCAFSFIGGTISGTTLYGSTAVCSPIGCFTTSCSQTSNNCTIRVSCRIVPVSNYRTSDCGYGGVDFFDNGKGYACSAKFYTFTSTTSEWYGMTNDYGAGASAQLALISCGAGGGNNISFFTGTSTTARLRIDNNASCFSQTVCSPGFVGGTISGTTGTFSSSVTGTSFEVGNGQYYTARRTSGNLLINLLGIESGTDNTRLLITGDFNIKNGALSTLFNMTTVGIACFACEVCARQFRGSSYAITPQGGTFRGGLYTCNQVSGTGTDCSISIFSEGGANGGSFYIQTGGQADVKFAMDGNGISCFRCVLCTPQGHRFGNGSTTLNYYEEGSWTPSLRGASVAGTFGYQFRSASYVRIGNYVFVRWGFKLNSASGASGVMQITGLPFTSFNWGSYQEPNVNVSTGLLATCDNSWRARVFVGGNTTYLEGRIANNGDTGWDISDFGGDEWVIGEIFYNV